MKIQNQKTRPESAAGNEHIYSASARRKQPFNGEPIIQSLEQRLLPDLKLSKKMARKHLSLLHEKGDDLAEFTFVFIDDRKKLPTNSENLKPEQVYHRGDELRVITKSATLDDLWPEIVEANRKGYGIFVCIQAMDNSGVRGAKNCKLIRTLVNDLDHGDNKRPYPVPPSWNVQSSKHGRHDYFAIEPVEKNDRNRALFTGIQTAFAESYDGDKNVKDLARVMRLPGTFHRKTDDPFLVTITVPAGDLSVCDLEELHDKLSPQGNAKPGSEAPWRTSCVDNIVSMVGKQQQREPKHDVQFARQLLRELDDRDPEAVDDRASWLMAGQCIHHETDGSEEGFQVFDEWSRKSDKHNDADTLKVWSSFSEGGSNGRPRTLDSLRYMARQGFDPDAEADEATLWPDRKGQNGDPNSTANIKHYIAQEGLKLWRNDFDRTHRYGDGDGKVFSDAFLRHHRMRMHEQGCRVTQDLLTDTFKWSADQNAKNPLCDWLDSLKWDGEERVHDWLTVYAGVEDSDYSEAVGKAFLISAVRRARKPGCQIYGMPVFEGPQGAKKSTLLRTLAPDGLFSDNICLGASSKEIIEQTAGAWIIEAPEMAGMLKREVEAVKAMLTRQSDKARAAYARTVDDVPRQFVLAGTTNSDKYLKDKTGNRRFWPLKVGKVRINKLEEDIEQLWAEAAHLEKKLEPHNIPAKLWAQARDEQAKREVQDPIEEVVTSLIEDDDEGFLPTDEIWEALGLSEVSKRTQAQNNLLAQTMQKLGWNGARRRAPKKDGRRVYGYEKWNEDGKPDWLKYDAKRKTFTTE